MLIKQHGSPAILTVILIDIILKHLCWYQALQEHGDDSGKYVDTHLCI